MAGGVKSVLRRLIESSCRVGRVLVWVPIDGGWGWSLAVVGVRVILYVVVRIIVVGVVRHRQIDREFVQGWSVVGAGPDGDGGSVVRVDCRWALS